MVAGPIRTEAQSHVPIRTGNKSTFFASPEGGTARTKSRTDQNRGTKSRTNQNWKQVHVAVDPPFTDCTQYLPRPYPLVSSSCRLSRHAVLRLMRPACHLKLMRGPHVRT